MGTLGIVVGYSKLGDPVVRLIGDSEDNKRDLILNKFNSNKLEISSLIEMNNVRLHKKTNKMLGSLNQIITDGELENLLKKIEYAWQIYYEDLPLMDDTIENFTTYIIATSEAYKSGNLEETTRVAILAREELEKVPVNDSIKEEHMIFYGMIYLLQVLEKTTQELDKTAKEYLAIS